MRIGSHYSLSHDNANIWRLLSCKSIREIATTVLFKKDMFQHLSFQPVYFKRQLGIKHPLLHQYISYNKQLAWDHKKGCSMKVDLFQRVYFVFYNLIYYCFRGSVRFEERQEFFLLKILEAIDLDTFHQDKEFLALSLQLRQQITKELKLNKDINFQIIARQIVHKIDSVHRLFLKLPLEDRENIYPGLPPFIANDPSLVLAQVKQNGLLLQHAPLCLNDQKIIKAAFMQNPSSLRFAHHESKNDPTFIKALISFSEEAYFEASISCQKDPEVVTELLKKNGKLLLRLSDEQRRLKSNIILSLQSAQYDLSVASDFTDDRDIMLAAYAKGCPLKMINPALNDDDLFVSKAIELRGWDVYNRASERVKALPHVKVAAYKKRFMKKSLHPDQIEILQKHCSQIFDDDEFIMNFVKTDGSFFQYASSRLKQNKTIILAAIKNEPTIFHHVHDSLLDKEFIIEILKCCPQLYPYIDDKLKIDHDVYTTAIFQNSFNYFHLPSALQNDSNLIKLLLLKDPQAAPIVKLDKLTSEDALSVLQTYGFLLHFMPFKTSLVHIKAALSSSPQIINTLDKETLSQCPELLRRYLLTKIDKGLINIGNQIYLPTPFCENEENTAETADIEAPQMAWEGLIEGQASDMFEFIDGLTLEKLKKAKFTIFPHGSIEEKKDQMKQSLNTLCARIKAKTPFLGTPKATDPEQLDLFYQTISYYLKRLAHVLLQDKSLVNERFQILEASNVCGGGLLSQLSELDRQLIVPPNCDLRSLIQFKLSKAAHQKIAILTRADGAHNVHKSNRLKWHFHSYIGGKKITFDHLAYDEDEIDISLQFFRLFNPKHLCQLLCDDLRTDEDFYEKLNAFIEEECTSLIADSKEANKICEEATLEFLELLDSHELQKAKYAKLIPLLPKLNTQQRYQALGIVQTSANKEMHQRILEVTFKEKISQDSCMDLIEMKMEFQSLHKYVSKVSFLTGASSKTVLEGSIKDLRLQFDEHFNELKKELLNRKFNTTYRDDSGLINIKAMALILEKMGFFEKFR